MGVRRSYVASSVQLHVRPSCGTSDLVEYEYNAACNVFAGIRFWSHFDETRRRFNAEWPCHKVSAHQIDVAQQKSSAFANSVQVATRRIARFHMVVMAIDYHNRATIQERLH